MVFKKGKKLTKEHKIKIGLANSISQKGKQIPEEVRKKISNTLKGRIASKGMTGKHHSKETKQKISNSEKGKKLTKEHIEKMRQANLGKKLSKETIQKIIQSRKINGKLWHSKETIEKMKEARKNQKNTFTSSIEVKIQKFLKQLGIEYFTHQYMKIEHGYQCDILIPSLNLVIECDGDYWHKYPIGRKIDLQRTQELLDKGFRVLRLWEHEIKVMNISKFKDRLK